MNGFCELTQEEQLVVEGGWQAVARRVIGEAALADAFVRSCELAANYIWNNRKIFAVITSSVDKMQL